MIRKMFSPMYWYFWRLFHSHEQAYKRGIEHAISVIEDGWVAGYVGPLLANKEKLLLIRHHYWKDIRHGEMVEITSVET